MLLYQQKKVLTSILYTRIICMNHLYNLDIVNLTNAYFILMLFIAFAYIWLG